MRIAERGKVYLVGAGPGSRELLTLRAHSLISTATCILHDDLVSAEILSLVDAGAMIRNVGKRCGEKKVTQEEINDWLVEFAQAGASVVRLKSGDPLLFGRAAEEIEALRRQGVPWEVVPGISAGFAAAALAGIPLTGRITSSRVVFATRHLAAGATNGLEGIGPDVTLVLYMPGRDYAAISSELSMNGWPAETRCIVVSHVGCESQELKSTSLLDLGKLTPLSSPTLMLFVAQKKNTTQGSE
jgi:uroporphyrin-III C-methyltransferase